MLNKMTFIAAATLALYGCGGDSGSSNKQPQTRTDYPIKGSLFTPSPSTNLSYTLTTDGQEDGEVSLNYQPIDAETLVERLIEKEPHNPILNIIYELNNNGITQFYLSEEVVNGIEEDASMYFAGTDGAMHEITDAYLMEQRFISTLTESSPLFRLKATDVKEADPNIDISSNTVSVNWSLTGTQLKLLLNDFDEQNWVKNLPDSASCTAWWQQQITEKGVRKSFKISGKSIEAAYLEETNTYSVNCDDLDSMEFVTTAERWFNPNLGLIQQIEIIKAENSHISEEKATLSKIEK
ncbi:hypothetical protein JCM19236_5254 [Vibrio sp. JCM 19236]|nr:hypothetical protein JCM19236_5254 [Vibrio sp. JCM 19236]